MSRIHQKTVRPSEHTIERGERYIVSASDNILNPKHITSITEIAYHRAKLSILTNGEQVKRFDHWRDKSNTEAILQTFHDAKKHLNLQLCITSTPYYQVRMTDRERYDITCPEGYHIHEYTHPTTNHRSRFIPPPSHTDTIKSYHPKIIDFIDNNVAKDRLSVLEIRGLHFSQQRKIKEFKQQHETIIQQLQLGQ